MFGRNGREFLPNIFFILFLTTLLNGTNAGDSDAAVEVKVRDERANGPVQESTVARLKKEQANIEINVQAGVVQVQCTVTNLGKKRFQVFKHKLKFTEALAFCKRKGLSLAEITSQEEMDDVVEQINNNVKDIKDYEGLWIGGSNLGEVNPFIWLNSGEQFGYTNWHSGEPSNNGGGQHCVQISKFPSGNALRMDDNYCVEPFFFICQQ